MTKSLGRWKALLMTTKVDATTIGLADLDLLFRRNL
jgi:hypothetical protein